MKHSKEAKFLQINDRGPIKVVLITVQVSGISDEATAGSLHELDELVKTAGGTVVGKIIQKRHAIDRANYLGSGKISDVTDLVAEKEAVQVVADDELSALQLRRLEEGIGVSVIDRTTVILEIFAEHASTGEGKLQVELARLQYRLIRLVGGYTALSRQRGGIGTKGPGETQIETDRRVLKMRIAHLKDELAKAVRNREIQRRNRTERFAPLFSMVGYTNAGKSTLLNALSGSNVEVRDGLFTTLDPASRRIELENGIRSAILSDTVGFIRKLPHGLVRAFRATLESVVHSQVIIVVCDISDPDARAHLDAVEEVLQELDASCKERIYVFNKIDKAAAGTLELFRSTFPDAIFLSAALKIDLARLTSRMSEIIIRNYERMELRIPSTNPGIRDILTWGIVESQDWEEQTVRIIVRLPQQLACKLRNFAV